MKLSFRATALQDLKWFELYHSERVSGGRKNAARQLRSTLKLLKTNAFAGKPVGVADARSFPVRKTPFVLHYLVVDDTIEILRVWDSRADPEKLIL
jgi:plasmid stabilization system protein ParE